MSAMRCAECVPRGAACAGMRPPVRPLPRPLHYIGIYPRTRGCIPLCVELGKAALQHVLNLHRAHREGQMGAKPGFGARMRLGLGLGQVLHQRAG